MVNVETLVNEVDSTYSELRYKVFHWIRKLESGKNNIRELMELMNTNSAYDSEEKAAIALAIVTYQSMIHNNVI